MYERIEWFKDSAQARLLVSLLTGNGFHARIGGPQGLGGSGARLAGGFEVCVPAPEAGAVRAFLAELAASAEDEEE